jgi:hypothetical protein
VLVDIEDFNFKDWTAAIAEPAPALAFHDDPLALSCASYRVGEETGARWQELDLMKPTDEDRNQAVIVRKYYTERLVMERLTKPRVSPFREKLGAFLAGNYQLTKKDIGLLYKLPYFYAEDQIIDSIMAETENIPDVGIHITSNVKKLKPLRKMFQSRKAGERTQFWFTTEENHPVAFTILHNNSLFGLFESLFDFPSITISSNFRLKEHFGHHRTYYSIYAARILELEPKHG